jgi:hypothetical protein
MPLTVELLCMLGKATAVTVLAVLHQPGGQVMIVCSHCKSLALSAMTMPSNYQLTA